MGFLFLRGIIRAIELNLNIIYIDETGFRLNNENLKIWRKDKGDVLGGAIHSTKEKVNAIMAVDKKEIILCHYYKGKGENISSKEFYEFFIDLIDTIGEEEIGNSLFVLDNAAYHCSKKIRKLSKENN